VAGGCGWQVIEIELDLLGIILRMDDELPISATSDRYGGEETDRCRHGEPIVVISVFADQVDSSRSLVDSRRISKSLNESLAKSVDSSFDR
jgi:hypothetical protein